MTPEEQRELDEWFIENTTKGLEHVDTLRQAFVCWRQRGRGVQLVGYEAILANHFDRLFQAKIFSEEHWAAFVHQLWRTVNPDKISLLDAVYSVCSPFGGKSWQDIKKDVALKYPNRRWGKSQWARVKKAVGPFSG